MQANMFDLHIYCALRRNSANKGFRLWIPMARQEFNRRKRRFNFCTSPGFEPEPGGVTGYLLLVSHPSPNFRVMDHPGTSCHPSAEGNFVPRRDEPSSPPLEGWAKPGVVRDCGIIHLVPLSSRAERGDPVNKKALRAFARRHIMTGLPQSYDNVFNIDRTPSQ